MKFIKYVLLVTATAVALAYVDIQINAMFSEPELLVFQKLFGNLKNVLK